MRIFAKTDKGIIRKINQDAFAVKKTDDGTVFAVVCDGMGGVNGGEEASSITVETVLNTIVSQYNSDMTASAIEILLDRSIVNANGKVKEAADKNEEFHGMGTTAVVVVVKKDAVTVAFVGDSRAYIISKHGIKQITHDHSIVQTMLDLGQITEEEAKIHPHRHIITRVVGSEDTVSADINTVEFKENDILLICTDGLSGCIEEFEIADIIRMDVENSVETLIKTAIDRGGSDNITAVIIENI